ncbi:MAG: threonylcarbamoyl-AMP synthase [Firmicutes bacterium]|nr:threonylcarbamoyl-AMP synthase [Bacillota bacterium]
MSGSKNTEVIRVDPIHPELDLIRRAARLLRDGGLVAFPTETVYGLGANALDEEAVKDIFRAKGRPADNPLIVHIARREDLQGVVSAVPLVAERLIDQFWPGPLTLIFPRHPGLPYVTTGGIDTVAVRMPDHDIALGLIAEAGVPVAAPSANTSGRPSPTAAEHVIDDLGGKVDLILDGGPTAVGVESTVLDITVTPPVILRPGGTTPEDIQAVIGEVILPGLGAREARHGSPGSPDLAPGIAEDQGQDQAPKAPGMKYRHYSPEAEVILFEARTRPGAGEGRVSGDRAGGAQAGDGAMGAMGTMVSMIWSVATRLATRGKRVGIMCTDETCGAYARLADSAPMGTRSRLDIVSSGTRHDLSTIASRIFALLRQFDDDGADVILVEGVDERGLGFAVMNRLRKAAGGRIILV